MESSPEHHGADSNCSTRQVVTTFYSSTDAEVEQHFTRALARLRNQGSHLEAQGTSEILGSCAEASSLCEVSRAQESDYGSANAAGGAYPYPPFVPFILHPDIDVTREVIRFPEEADECVDLSYSSRAHFILSNPQSYDPETVALHSSPEFQSSCSESASSRPPAHHEGLLDPLGLLSDAELLGVLMNC